MPALLTLSSVLQSSFQRKVVQMLRIWPTRARIVPLQGFSVPVQLAWAPSDCRPPFPAGTVDSTTQSVRSETALSAGTASAIASARGDELDTAAGSPTAAAAQSSAYSGESFGGSGSGDQPGSNSRLGPSGSTGTAADRQQGAPPAQRLRARCVRLRTGIT